MLYALKSVPCVQKSLFNQLPHHLSADLYNLAECGNGLHDVSQIGSVDLMADFSFYGVHRLLRPVEKLWFEVQFHGSRVATKCGIPLYYREVPGEYRIEGGDSRPEEAE